MQAYRQSYCDDDESSGQRQMYRASSASSQGQYSAGGGMHHASAGGMRHSSASGGMHHSSAGGMHHSAGGMHHSSASGGMHHSSASGGMHHSSASGSMQVMQGGMHQAGGMSMHQGSGMGMHQQGAGAIIQKTSSMKIQSTQSMTVFGQDAFCDIQPSAFPPGTDPKVIECYNRIDRDGNGLVDDKELMSVLSNCSHSFGLRTVHLLMYEFTHSNKRMIGPKEFVPLLKCLQTWRAMFQRFDRDRNGSIDSSELGEALSCLGYRVSPVIVHLLVSKFSKSGRCTLRYDSFIECCLTVKGLTETFQAKAECGKAAFCYEEFLLNVLPFIIA